METEIRTITSKPQELLHNRSIYLMSVIRRLTSLGGDGGYEKSTGFGIINYMEKVRDVASGKVPL